MSEARYPSKERVERDGVLVHAEGDDLINDPDEARRQGYDVDEDNPSGLVRVTERVERDGVLVHAEGDLVAEDAVADDVPVEPVEKKADEVDVVKVSTPATTTRAPTAKK